MNNEYEESLPLCQQAGCANGGCSSCPSMSCGGCGTAQAELPGTITLTMEDDSEVECAVLTVFRSEGEDFIALLPLDENGQNDSGEVYLYHFSLTAQGEPILTNIEEDSVYDRAAGVFQDIARQAFPKE